MMTPPPIQEEVDPLEDEEDEKEIARRSFNRRVSLEQRTLGFAVGGAEGFSDLMRSMRRVTSMKSPAWRMSGVNSWMSSSHKACPLPKRPSNALPGSTAGYGVANSDGEVGLARDFGQLCAEPYLQFVKQGFGFLLTNGDALLGRLTARRN